MRNIIKVQLNEDNRASGRKGIIGGSDIGIIMGTAKYGSKYQLAMRYLGRKTSEVSREQQKTFDIGKAAEPYIAARFEIETGYRVFEPDWLCVAEEDTGLVAHIDRLLVNTVEGKKCGLECKHVAWQAANAPDSGWGEEGTAQIPPYVLAQALWYCELWGLDRMYVARLTDDDVFIYVVDRDDELQAKILKKVIAFKKNLDKGLVPQPSTGDDMKIAYPKQVPGKKIVADDRLTKLLERHKKASERKKKAEKTVDDLKTRIIGIIGDGESVVDSEDREIATFKASVSVRMDSDKVKGVFNECDTITDRFNAVLKEHAVLVREDGTETGLPEGVAGISVRKEDVRRAFEGWESDCMSETTTRTLRHKAASKASSPKKAVTA